MSAKIAVAALGVSLAAGFYTSCTMADVHELKQEVETISTQTVPEIVPASILGDFQQCENFPFDREVPDTLTYSSGQWWFQNYLVAEVDEESDDFYICQPSGIMSMIMKGYSE